jgi:hypothetical protein
MSKNFQSPKKFQSVENWLCSAKMLKKFFVGRMLKIFLSPDRKILEISFVVRQKVCAPEANRQIRVVRAMHSRPSRKNDKVRN